MGAFVAGLSRSRDCGRYVMVGVEALDWLEREAEEARTVFERARWARSPAELCATLSELPLMFRFGVDVRSTDRHDPCLDWDALEEVPVGEELWRDCVERVFPAGSDVDLPAVRDTHVCFESLAGIPEVAAHLRCAATDVGAGIDDLEGAMAALRQAGHTVTRDDARLARVFGRMVTPRYVLGGLLWPPQQAASGRG